MATNLSNVYAFMRNSYPDCSILYNLPVSYLKSLIGEDSGSGKVIFLYQEDKSRGRESSNSISPNKLNMKQETDLDVTGSPLKDDCVVDAIDMSIDLRQCSQSPWTKDEEFHRGLSLNKARSVLCDPALQELNIATGSHGSVWILCNSSDAEKTLFLQMEFTKGFFSRGIITFQGITPTYAVNSQDMFQKHFTLIRKGSKVDSTIECFYNIKSNISLKCFWSTTSVNPALNNLKSSDVTLYQTFSLSDCNLTEEFMNQLRRLMYIKDDIISYKENGDNGKEAVYRCGIGIDMHQLKEKVMNVMTEISGFADVESYSSSDDDIEAVVKRAKMRRLTDLTDKLWDILKCCSSYKDLKQAFNFVFQCAAKCNIVNTPTNKNRLAEIIKEVANRRLAIPCLTGSEPLELLLEIGLEKLFKDYEFILTECKICSSNDLRGYISAKSETNSEIQAPINLRKSLCNAIRPESIHTSGRKTLLHSNNTDSTIIDSEIVGFQNSKFDRRNVDYRLAKLLQIHLALEHLIMIQINLNLTNVYGYICEQLLKKSPRIVNSIDDSLLDKIEIPIIVDNVRQHLENKDPQARRITLKSMNNFREVQSTFFYSMEKICPPQISEYFQTDDKEMVKENLYYCWQYTKVKTVTGSKEA